ncbi:MAG TPA: cytochrome c oxidase subunit 3 [Gaiellaceae bacterium]|nr:cytochrome c oxidase subunit 3 [Gaiellaceae bacterium]
MTELVQEATAYDVVEGEPPELLGRNLNSGAHLFASATAFFFLAFVFAYFYLRAQNNAGLWKPKKVDPSVAWGTVVMALAVASALLVRLGLQRHRAGRREEWRRVGVLALVVGFAAAVLQVVEWTTLHFGPTDGGYASVFYGWTAFQLLFTLGTLLWLENVVATSWRYRKVASGSPGPGEASGDPHRTGHDVADPLSLVRPGLEAVSFYWGFVAALGVLLWVVLYLA